MSQARQIAYTTRGHAASDGAGVRLTRIIGAPDLDHVDPFLLFDVFRSDDPNDYIAGFPPHPHRGFETVTYMLAGNMRHRDNAGNEGVIRAGGVQWMTAGRGIVHSEMPEQQDGLLWGTQLWVNLPRDHKMATPAYHEYAAADIPELAVGESTTVRVVAGEYAGATGPVRGRPTDPLYLDLSMDPGGSIDVPLPGGHSAFVFVIDGLLGIGDDSITAGTLATLSDGNSLRMTSEPGARALLVAARALREPIARGGPFVMNTREEVLQAFADFRDGRF